MEEFNVDYGETAVALKVHCNTASIESLLAMAIEIYHITVKSEIPIERHEECEELLLRIKSRYKDFALSFPLILKWIVLTRQFHPEAFRKYLVMYSSINIKTREEFLMIQVEYLVYLYKELRPELTESFCHNMRKNMLAAVMEEDKQFVEQHKNTPPTVIKN